MFYKVYLSVIAFLFGLVVGSFDNVAIYRVPEGESLVSPRSFCPKCKNPIAWYDNIPLISYIILRGRCRHCGLSISPRYPLVEMTSGLLFLAVFAKSGFTWNDEFPFHLFMVTVLLIVSVMDLQKQVIPNKIILLDEGRDSTAFCKKLLK
ncbi:MAG: prepilin peptidase, partial [Actinomycetota bacterium]